MMCKVVFYALIEVVIAIMMVGCSEMVLDIIDLVKLELLMK